MFYFEFRKIFVFAIIAFVPAQIQTSFYSDWTFSGTWYL